MDILAWIILTVFASAVLIPILGGMMSKDHFISYKDAWIAGHAVLLCGVAIGSVMFAVVWAAEQVLW